MMTTNDQIKDEKLQYNITREAAKISALSSGKLHKYEYLTGEDILPSNQQQIIEQTKFTYSSLGKAFDKKIKTIEDQGKKQVDALEKLKTKEVKPIEDKPNNQLKAATVFNELINKRKELMNKLYDSVDYNNLKCEYVGSTEDVSFYEYMDSKELFNAIRGNKIGFSEAKNKQNDFLNKLTNIKIGRKTLEQEKIINSLERMFLGKKFLIFLETTLKCFLMQITVLNKIRLKEQSKLLTPEQMLQRLPIALAQVKAGNNSENLLNEVRQIIYSLYQSKEITKKVYNNLMKSL